MEKAWEERLSLFPWWHVIDGFWVTFFSYLNFQDNYQVILGVGVGWDWKKLCRALPPWSLDPADSNDIISEQAEEGCVSLQEAPLADAGSSRSR